MPLRAEVASKVAEINSVREVVRYMRSEFFDLGAKRMSYHLVPPLNNPLNNEVVIVHAGFDDGSMELYGNVTFRQTDPIALEVMRTRKMMTWQQALAGKKLNDDEVAFIRALRKFELIDGWSIPLFGPNGRNGYCSASLNRQLTDADNSLGQQFQELALIGHQRLCEIISAREQTKCALSERETDVLQWICKGKSNNDIATIIGLSTSTVDTYVRRIFNKLGASSRIGATVGALSLGLIKLSR
jgi:DNA-binding CsgD family transcriptional regulator